MAQKSKSRTGRPRADLERYFTKIFPYLALGYSLHKACLYGKVPYSTVLDYSNAQPTFREKCLIAQSDASVRARQVWIQKIRDGSYQASKEWLERFESEEFSLVQRDSKLENPWSDLSEEELNDFIETRNQRIAAYNKAGKANNA